jgi:OmcA/MtrC family decaheme c-type cytochrome
MITSQNKYLGLAHFYMVCALTLGLAGCSGSDGAPGAAGTPGPGVATLADATALNISITGASVGSPPVVNFKVTNQDGVAVAGFADTDLRFNIAKLIPGQPTRWQNYINRANAGAVQGSQERLRSGYPWGTLADHKDGTFTYTFATDITNAAATCPAPCTDADGNALDTSYQPTLTHRISIQQSNSALPKAAATFDFVPAGGAVSTTRDIVNTAKCNECHNQLVAHGTRIDTKLCVTCHNPGSWVAGSPNTSVDFKVYIHKIHMSENLPSVLDPDGNPATTTKGTYAIGTSDFSDVAFPQDIRNCTKCHDGTTGASNATAQGDNWKNQTSKAACSSCHDDLYFGVSPDPAKPYQVVSHMTLITTAGGVAVADPADSLCVTCHVSGQLAGSVDEKHTIPSKVVRGNFKFNIIEICGTAVASHPVCAPGSTPTIKFSVTDPTGATTHGYGNKYSLFADPEFWNSGTSAARGSMSVDIAWDTRDYNNTGGYAARPARANQINVFGTTAASTNYGNPSIAAYPRATDNGDGTYTATALGPIPNGTLFPNVAASGSGVVAIEGRAFNTLSGLTSTEARVPIKGEVAYFGITDATPVVRRVVADATSKCDKCHDQLSLHGGSRNDNVQLCVLCHNPNNTDAQASARPKWTNHLPIGDNPAQVALLTPPGTVPADGKKEESVDFKRMIHGIHAGAKTSLDGTTTLYGFREKGIWVSGTDFSGMRFPGILNDCSTCHTGTSYQLTGIWELPTQTGHILASTIDSTTGLTAADLTATVDGSLQNPVDDLNITPIAAVCSSCHDGDLPKQHMLLNGASFAATQANITAGTGSYETCAVCHGPGRTADVKVVHGVP